MDKVMQILRYILFVLFIICNAIICSVAVWNLSLARSLGWDMQVDVYLIFTGALGLAFSFVLMFIELLRPSAFTSSVWFECVWVGIFWIMELAGASALLAIVPTIMCNPFGVIIFRTRFRTFVDGACTSTQVLLAFSWICTILLLCYLCFLLVSALMLSRTDPKVWFSSVRDVQWSHSRRRLTSAPSSPTLPRFLKKNPTIVAPRPRRAAQPTKLYAYRSGLSTEYEIEHYQLPETIAAPAPTLTRPVPVVSPPSRPQYVSNPHPAPQVYPAMSFYPQYMQPTRLGSQDSPAVSRSNSNSNSQSHGHPQPQPMSSSPPPLGDWPRSDALSRPPRTKRRPPPPVETALRQPDATAASPVSSSNRGMTISGSSPSRSRPTGPRTRSSSGGRPPPLDLSEISTHSRRR